MRQRLHQAETGLLVVAHDMAGDDLTVAQMDPHRLRFGDQVSDREHEPGADQHAIAGSLGSQRIRSECVRRNDGVQPDHGRERRIEVVLIGVRLRLQ